MTEPNASPLADFTERDLKNTLMRALRWVGILGVLGALAIWGAAGWQSAAMF
ncbi:MAG: hypothetical protein QOK38_2713, partial [Acidobacteriaceae bacterium]|nr:hypothetical protein [Acidobacteriaceae bacterium]